MTNRRNTMTAADLYQQMKDALTFFGLNFHQMDQVSVWPSDDGKGITFKHRGATITLPLLEDDE